MQRVLAHGAQHDRIDHAKTPGRHQHGIEERVVPHHLEVATPAVLGCAINVLQQILIGQRRQAINAAGLYPIVFAAIGHQVHGHDRIGNRRRLVVATVGAGRQGAINSLSASAAQGAKRPRTKVARVAKALIDQPGQALFVALVAKVEFAVKLVDAFAGFDVDVIRAFVFADDRRVIGQRSLLGQARHRVGVQAAGHDLKQRLVHGREELCGLKHIVRVMRLDEGVVAQRSWRQRPVAARRVQALMGFAVGAQLDELFKLGRVDGAWRLRDQRRARQIVFAAPRRVGNF